MEWALRPKIECEMPCILAGCVRELVHINPTDGEINTLSVNVYGDGETDTSVFRFLSWQWRQDGRSALSISSCLVPTGLAGSVSRADVLIPGTREGAPISAEAKTGRLRLSGYFGLSAQPLRRVSADKHDRRHITGLSRLTSRLTYPIAQHGLPAKDGGSHSISLSEMSSALSPTNKRGIQRGN